MDIYKYNYDISIQSLCIYIMYVCTYMYVCMYEFKYACMNLSMHVCIYA